MAASILLLNPNRHRASDKLTKSANRNPVENNMRRDTNKCKSKSPVKGKIKNKPWPQRSVHRKRACDQ